MGDFLAAFEKTMGHEGGYANDPDDVGGETYKGVARRYYPSWSGWKIIDSYKHEEDFPTCLDTNQRLQEKIVEFYKIKYWDVWLGDQIHNQEICEEMFDTGVNMGTHRCQKFLQQSLNYLNRNQRSYPDVVVDADVGPKTLKALGRYLQIDTSESLLKVMNILQGQHYLNYMDKSPSQEKFARGWLKRVSFCKK
jgi:lysozyme family protein